MLRYTVRTLLRNPGFTAAAVLCLALGIGATSAIFSIVNAVVMRPLPYPESDRLVRVYTEFPTFPNGGLHKFTVSEPEVFDLRRSHSFESIGAWASAGANIAGLNRPVRITASFLSAPLLPMLRVKPLLGRTISADEDVPNAAPVVILSYTLWQHAFSSDPQIVGRDTYLNSARAKIIGIMPKGFIFPPGTGDETEAWSALQLDPNSTNRGGHNFNVLARLRPGVTIAQARSDMASLVAAIGHTSSPNNHVFNPETHPVTEYDFHDEVVGDGRRPMLMLLGAVMFVLLIACVNVANLLLARSEARRRETAVRRAIGASSRHLLKQFLFEGTFLSLAGACLGMLVAAWSMQLVRSMSAGSIPRAGEISIDIRVLLFTLAVALVTGILFGLAPFVHVSASRIFEALKATSRSSGSSGSNRFRAALVIAQVSLAFLLMVGAGLMVRAFWRLQKVDPGFNPENLLTFSLDLPAASYRTPLAEQQFWTRLQERLSRIPGVTSAAMMIGLPPLRPAQNDDTSIENFVKVPGGPIESVDYYQVVDETFFQTLGVRLVEGRFLWPQDSSPSSPGLVINETMARTFWPHRSALGRRVQPGFPGSPWITVVGVVSDLKNAGLNKPTQTELFLPYRLVNFPHALDEANVVVKTSGDPLRLVGALRRAVADVDSSLPMAKVRTMQEVVADANSRPRFLTIVLGLFSALALVMASLGIYGVISYSVAQRNMEFGIKLALGANPASMLWQVIGMGALLGGTGIACGAAAALLLTRSLEGLLFGVSRFDAVSFAGTAVVLMLVVIGACAVPALRAMRIQPVQALRYE